jgi:hypothetical protein
MPTSARFMPATAETGPSETKSTHQTHKSTHRLHESNPTYRHELVDRTNQDGASGRLQEPKRKLVAAGFKTTPPAQAPSASSLNLRQEPKHELVAAGSKTSPPAQGPSASIHASPPGAQARARCRPSAMSLHPSTVSSTGVAVDRWAQTHQPSDPTGWIDFYFPNGLHLARMGWPPMLSWSGAPPNGVVAASRSADLELLGAERIEGI